MKSTYFLKLEIELAELKLKLAHHRLDKHHALQNEKFDQAADTRKWEKEITTHIRSLIEGAIYTFTYHVQKADRKIYRPQLERFLEDANLALQSKTRSHLELSQTDTQNPTQTQTPIQTPTPNQSATATEAFQEHFAHTFVQLTALHEKLMDEGKYEAAGKVLEMSLGVVRYLGGG
jgi:hypothetical protein